MTARISAEKAIGMKFGRLTIESIWKRNKNYTAQFNCRCECGGTTHASLQALRQGRTYSCGCGKTERIGALRRRHSLTGTKVYTTWSRMFARCENPKTLNYPKYGGRGIRVCERWHTFENFLEDMGKPPSDQHSLDRIDNNGNYEPDNCRWATTKEQIRNRSITRLFDLNGESRPLGEWCERHGANYELVRLRIKRGWSLLDALTKEKRIR